MESSLLNTAYCHHTACFIGSVFLALVFSRYVGKEHARTHAHGHARTHLFDLSFNLAHLIPSPVTQLPVLPPTVAGRVISFAQNDARRA